MSTTIDSKVVELKFDNSKFEQNVKTSMSTLEKLKETLHFDGATKGFEEINKAASKVDLSGMGDSIEAITVKFSALDVVAMTVISNITTSVMRAASNLTSSVSNMIVTGGINRAKKLADAKFMLEGLGVEWNQISEDINYGVADTAYGLDAAAKAASQLVASGVQFGETSEMMRKSLRGISGVAAMTNSDYESIAAIFTTVAGQGKLMTMQLRQLESRGLNAAAQMGKVLGKTEGEIRDMVTKGKIDFETFSAAMDDAFGAHAKDANKTFAGVMSNIRSAFAKIGADVAGPAMDAFIEPLNSIRAHINGVRSSLQPLIGVINEIVKDKATKLDKAFKWMEKPQAFSAFNNFMEKSPNKARYLRKVLVDEFAKGDEEIAKRLKMGLSYESVFNYMMHEGKITAKSVKDAFAKFKEEGEASIATMNKLALSEDYVSKKAYDVWRGLYGNGQTRKDLLGDEYDQIQDYVNHLILGTETHYEYSKSAEVAKESTEDLGFQMEMLQHNLEDAYSPLSEFIAELMTPRELLVGALYNAFMAVKKIVDSVKEAFHEVFNGDVAKTAYQFCVTLYLLSDRLTLSDEKAKDLKQTFVGLFDIVDLVAQVFLAIARAIYNVAASFKGANTNILGMTANVGVAIDKFHDWVVENDYIYKGVSKIITVIASMIIRVKNAVNQFMQLSIVKTIINGVKSAFEGIVSTVSTFVSTMSSPFETLTNTVGSLKEKLSGVGERFPYLNSALTRLGNAFKTLKKNLADLVANRSSVLPKLQSLLSTLYGHIKNLFNKVLESPRLYSILQVLGGVAIGACDMIINGLASVVESISTFIDAISGADQTEFKGLIGSLEDLGGTADSVGAKKIGGFFHTITEGFKSVADSAKGSKKPVEMAGNVLNELSEMLGMQDFKQLFLDIFAVSTGIVAIMGAKKLYQILDTLSGNNPFYALNVSIGQLNRTIKAFRAQMNLRALATSILEIAAAIGILAFAMIKIAELDEEEFKQGLIGLGLIAGGLIGLSVALGAINIKFWRNATIPLISMAIALTILVGALMLLSKLDTDGIWGKIGALYGILAGLVAAMTLINGTGGVSQVFKTKSLISMAASMLILVGALKLLETVDLNGIWTRVGILEALLLGMAAALRIAGSLGPSSALAGIGIAFIAAAVLAMAIALKIICTIDVKNVMSHIQVLIAIIASLVILMAGTMLAGPYAIQAGIGLLAIVAALYLMAGAIKVLGTITPAELRRAKQTITSMLGIFAGLMLMTNMAGQYAARAGAMLILVAGSLLLIAAAMVVISQIPAEGLKRATIAIAAVIVAMSTLIFASSTLANSDYRQMIIIISLIGLVVALAAAIFLLANVDANQLKLITTALTVLIGALSVLTVVSAGAASFNTAGILLLIGVIAALTAAIVVLDQVDASVAIQNAISISLLALALSGAIAILSLIPALNPAAILTSLIAVGALFTEIVGLIAILGELSDTRIGEDVIKGIALIGEAIGTFWDSMGKADASDNGSLTDKLPELGKNLSDFATNIKPFFETFSTMDVSLVNSAKALIEAILGLFAVNFVSFISGKTKTIDVDKITETLTGFADCMIAFGDKMKYVELEPITQGADAAAALVDVLQAMPRSGGFIQDIIGSKTWSTLSDGLLSFAIALVSYSETLKLHNFGEEDVSVITSSITAATSLNDLLSAIPRDNGLIQSVIGQKSWSTLSDGLVSFANAIVMYALGLSTNNFSADDTARIEESVKAASALNDLLQAVPKDDGKWQQWFGSKSFSSFDGLKEFGVGLRDFCKSIGSLQPTEISSASVIAKGIDDLTAALSNLNASGISSFSDEIKNGIGNMISNLDVTLTLLVAEVDTYEDDYSNAFAKMVTTAQNTFFSMLDDMIAAVSRYTGDFAYVGGQLVEGFVNGIKNNAFKAKVAAIAMANAAKTGAMAALNEHSPSRVFYQIGDYAGQGFVNALEDSEASSWKSGSAIAASAIDGLKNAIRGINDVVADEIQNDPVIKPVLDLTDIQNGVGSIDSMFSRTQAYSIAGAGSLYSRMTAENEMAAALSGLQAQLSGYPMNNTTYNINGITYDDGSNVASAIQTLVNATRIERRM